MNLIETPPPSSTVKAAAPASPPSLDSNVYTVRGATYGAIHRYRNSPWGNWRHEHLDANSRWLVLYEDVEHGEQLVVLASLNEQEVTWKVERWRLVNLVSDGIVEFTEKY